MSMPIVLVFDCGWGGRMIGEYIKQELPVEVRRVTDRRDYGNMDPLEVRDLVAEKLAPHTGAAEVIVLANPVMTLAALESLRRRFPEQKFIGYGGDITELIHDARQVLIFAPEKIRRVEGYQKIKAECGTSVVEPDCKKWISMMKSRGIPTAQTAKGVEVGAKILLLHPDLLFRRRLVEEAVGWRGEVVNMREKMVKDLKEELGLQGWKV